MRAVWSVGMNWSYQLSKYDGSKAARALVVQEEHFKVYCKMWLSLLFPVRSAAVLWINWRAFKEVFVTSGTSKCFLF